LNQRALAVPEAALKIFISPVAHSLDRRSLLWADMDAVVQSWKLVDTAWRCQPTLLLGFDPDFVV